MTKYKTFNFVALLLTLGTVGISYLMFSQKCFGECEMWTISSTIKPLFFGGIAISASLVLLLFFPSTIFKRWLRYIAGWYVPLSILLVLSTPRSGGGMLMPDQGIFAVQLMSILFVITAVYAVVQYWRGR